MAEHDFRYTLLSPQHTLNECRALVPGRYQVTGIGGSIKAGDTLLVTLRGSRELFMRLNVEKVRHLINPPGQWVAVANGPAFKELAIHQWQLNCDDCGKQVDFEFAVDAALGTGAREKAAEDRLRELKWTTQNGKHICPECAAG
ncbi:hypothetical protein [Pseudomonas matsuisoli]|uniref:Uncharacterized protein n=1 Tax=Pseudomonas matsuisoli TaxID=1515666 RepID=A0A917UWL9_9PSED|nr:hypothetical protein [Pseudomonas matsuisoli]GGJ90935.1 hypothetical protein GCM10009304_15760 [Pseudomonas matsuisoli]